MPIYNFHCNRCEVGEEVILPLASRNDTRLHSCGSEMVRVMSLPLPPIMKHTAKDMALDTINHPEGLPTNTNPYKRREAVNAVLAGLEKNSPNIYKGF